jgi:predicted MFS family arabinose efflux permease
VGAASCLFVNRVGMMVMPFLTLYLERTDAATRSTSRGGSLSLYGLGSILGVTAGGWLSDRFRPRRVQLAGGPNALFLFLLGTARSTLAIGAAIVAASMAAAAFRPANGAAISPAVGPEAPRAFSR